MNSKMKFIINILLITAVTLAGFLGCGDEFLSDIKDFKPDIPPVITSFTTDIAAGTEILPNMEVNLTVEAYDRDNDPIGYNFSSNYGTFRKLEATSSGCTIQFFISNTCPTSESIPITVTASDDRNGYVSETIDIGDGRALPGVSITWPASSILTTGGAALSFTPDCSGFYQIRAASSDTTDIDFDGQSYPCFFCYKDTEVTLTIYPGTGTDSETSAYLDLTSSGTYNVFLIIYDNFQRQATEYQQFSIIL